MNRTINLRINRKTHAVTAVLKTGSRLIHEQEFDSIDQAMAFVQRKELLAFRILINGKSYLNGCQGNGSARWEGR